MENIDEIGSNEKTQKETDPWTDIWIRPRKAINWVISQDKLKCLNLQY